MCTPDKHYWLPVPSSTENSSFQQKAGPCLPLPLLEFFRNWQWLTLFCLSLYLREYIKNLPERRLRENPCGANVILLLTVPGDPRRWSVHAMFISTLTPIFARSGSLFVFCVAPFQELATYFHGVAYSSRSPSEQIRSCSSAPSREIAATGPAEGDCFAGCDQQR